MIHLHEDHDLKSDASNKVMCEEDIIGQRASIVYEAVETVGQTSTATSGEL